MKERGAGLKIIEFQKKEGMTLFYLKTVSLKDPMSFEIQNILGLLSFDFFRLSTRNSLLLFRGH